MTATTLADLVVDIDRFFAEDWAVRPAVYRSMAVTGLISEAEMWDALDCGLLVRPYFTVFCDGVRSALASITLTRTVVGKEVAGYADPDAVRADFAAGGTFKLNQPEHWHHRLAALLTGLAPSFTAELESFVFLSPPATTALQAHTDGAHVFVLQMQGAKDWFVGLPDDDSVSDSRLSEIDPDRCFRATLTPGDVLYMPHGSPHYATAREGHSVHVAITVEEPSAKKLAEVALADFLASPVATRIEGNHHELSPAEKCRWLRAALGDHLRSLDDHQLVELALEG
jgi:hypothetical protein